MLADPSFREASCAAGTIRLEPDGAGTREVVELEIEVEVPLVGGKLEELMAEKVAAGMDVEHAVRRGLAGGALTMSTKLTYEPDLRRAADRSRRDAHGAAFRERVCDARGALRKR